MLAFPGGHPSGQPSAVRHCSCSARRQKPPKPSLLTPPCGCSALLPVHGIRENSLRSNSSRICSMACCVARWRESRPSASPHWRIRWWGIPSCHEREAQAKAEAGAGCLSAASFRPRRFWRASQRPAGRDSRAPFLFVPFLWAAKKRYSPRGAKQPRIRWQTNNEYIYSISP